MLRLFLLHLFIYFLTSSTVLAQSETTHAESVVAQDSCLEAVMTAGLKTSLGIFTAGELPISVFNGELTLVLFSKCLKKNYTVRNYRMIGVTEDKEPIIFLVAGGKIKNEHKRELLRLGEGFDLYFENIRIDNQGDFRLNFMGMLALKVR